MGTMKSMEPKDPAAFMQGQIAALEVALRAFIEHSPNVRNKLSTAAGRLAAGIAQDAPEDFADGWYHTLRRLNGGSLPVVGNIPE